MLVMLSELIIICISTLLNLFVLIISLHIYLSLSFFPFLFLFAYWEADNHTSFPLKNKFFLLLFNTRGWIQFIIIHISLFFDEIKVYILFPSEGYYTLTWNIHSKTEAEKFPWLLIYKALFVISQATFCFLFVFFFFFLCFMRTTWLICTSKCDYRVMFHAADFNECPSKDVMFLFMLVACSKSCTQRCNSYSNDTENYIYTINK